MPTTATILAAQRQALRRYRLKRVYYSAFSPIPDAAAPLPPQAPPLLREHRLYQADWLLRFYGFDGRRDRRPAVRGGMLDLAHRPEARLGAAAPRPLPGGPEPRPREMLLRVPGLGAQRRAHRCARRHGRLAPTTWPPAPVAAEAAALRHRSTTIRGVPDALVALRAQLVRNRTSSSSFAVGEAMSLDRPVRSAIGLRRLARLPRAALRRGRCAARRRLAGPRARRLFRGSRLLPAPATRRAARPARLPATWRSSLTLSSRPGRRAPLYRLFWRLAHGEPTCSSSPRSDAHRAQGWTRLCAAPRTR